MTGKAQSLLGKIFTGAYGLLRDSLSDQDAAMLLNTLIQWLIQLCNSGAPKVVIKKLCSALVSYYLRPSGVWKQCIRHLVLCMNDGEVIPVTSMYQRPPTSSVVPSLTLNSTLAILWFARSLAEEVGKAYSSSLQTYASSIWRWSFEVLTMTI